MKSIVLLDLDGTLWIDRKIPVSALEALKQAQANGHILVVNTGRVRNEAGPWLEHLPLSGQSYSDGTEIWLEGSRIHFHPIPEDIAADVLARLQEQKCGLAVQSSSKTFVNQGFTDFICSIIPEVPTALLNRPQLEDIKEENFQDMMKFSVSGANSSAWTEFLAEKGMQYTDLPVPGQNPRWNDHGDITQTGLDKGSAIAFLKERFGSLPIIAIGDSANDLPMFEKANISVAMGNALPSIQQAADYVTTPIDQDGVFNAFLNLGLLNQPAIWTEKEKKTAAL